MINLSTAVPMVVGSLLIIIFLLAYICLVLILALITAIVILEKKNLDKRPVIDALNGFGFAKSKPMKNCKTDVIQNS